MTALAHERPEAMPEFSATGPENGPGLDEVVRQAWKAMELPEGYRAEIIEGAIEVSPTGRLPHAQIVNRLRNALVRYLGEGEYSACQDAHVAFRGRSGFPTSSSRPRIWSPTRTRTRAGCRRGGGPAGGGGGLARQTQRGPGPRQEAP